MPVQAPAQSPSPTPATLPEWALRLTRPSPQYPRSFVPMGIDLGNWEALAPLLQNLEDRDLPDREALVCWLNDWWEFGDAFGEESSRRYILMTCDTADKVREAAYLHFVENIDPLLAPIYDRLNRKAEAHRELATLDEKQYGPWRRSLKTSIELFSEANIPLYTEISKLTQTYQKTIGDMSVEWEGQKKTLSQLAPFLQDPNRALREKAWRASAERRLQDAQKLNDLFDSLMQLRAEIAKNLGLKNYVEYAFKSYLRTDYGPEDCKLYHEAVAQSVVPVYRESLELRRKQMGLDSLRPWDLSCDPLGRPPLKPFATSQRLIEGVGNIFAKLHPDLSAMYQGMTSIGVMDLENRHGKAPGGYQCSLSEVRQPFIFMNAVGLNDDVFTLLHESGHAFHYLLARDLNPPFNRSAPMEFSEVASMSMERLGAKYLEEFYTADEKKRAMRAADEEVFRLLCWVAIIDAYQHWMYTTPHDQVARRAKWLELEGRFGSNVDWTGLEDYRANAWHRQLHLFEVPFYYIEYGIAQLGALQVWQNSLQSEAKAIELYKQGLSLGGSRGLRALFEATGLKFDFSQQGIAPLLATVRENWRRNVEGA
jgi:oligoendopeptidase F